MACTASSTTHPSPAATWYSFSSPRSPSPETAASGADLSRSGPFLDELHQVRRQRRLRLASYQHTVPFRLYDDLLARLALVGVRIIAAGMGTAALVPLQRGARG